VKVGVDETGDYDPAAEFDHLFGRGPGSLRAGRDHILDRTVFDQYRTGREPALGSEQ